MLAGQIKAAAFVDEMAKLAISSKWQHEIGAAMSGLLGAAGLYKHGPWGEGGRSKGEAKASCSKVRGPRSKGPTSSRRVEKGFN